MTSVPDQLRRWRRCAGLLLAAVLLASCSTMKVDVDGEFPEPLMSQLPLTIGVWYDEDFSNHEFFDEASGRAEPSWLVRTGPAQIKMWDTVLGGMFVNLVHMKNPPGTGKLNQVVDAILVPRVDELQYAIPQHTNIKVYEIWMRYHFDLVSNAGKPIASWTMSAYGKTPTAFLRSDTEAVNLAAVVALRDAGANFAVNFTRVPEVRDWLQNRPKKKAAPPGSPAGPAGGTGEQTAAGGASAPVPAAETTLPEESEQT
jgi:hypothetical protein